MQQIRKILLCVTGSAAHQVSVLLKGRGCQVYANDEQNREIIKEHMQNRSMHGEMNDASRIIVISNPVDRINNKMLKNYKYMVLCENRISIPDNKDLTLLYNMTDFFVDSRTGLSIQLDALLKQLLKK